MNTTMLNNTTHPASTPVRYSRAFLPSLFLAAACALAPAAHAATAVWNPTGGSSNVTTDTTVTVSGGGEVYFSGYLTGTTGGMTLTVHGETAADIFTVAADNFASFKPNILVDSGTLKLTNLSDYYTGEISVTGTGVLASNYNAYITIGGATGTTGVTLSDSGKLDFSGGGTIVVKKLTGSSGTKVVLPASGTNVAVYSGTFAGVISGGGTYSGLSVGTYSASTLTLTGVNTYVGPTEIKDSGKLVLSGGGSIADSSGVALTGSAPEFHIEDITPATSATIKGLGSTSSPSTTAKVFLGNKTLIVNGTVNEARTFAGVISGTDGSLTKSGVGTLTLSGANLYTGLTTVSDTSTLILDAIGSIAASSGLSLTDSAKANFSTNFISGGMIIKNLNGTGSTGLILPTGAALQVSGAGTFAGVISGGVNAALSKTTSGTLTLTGANTYPGSTSVSGTAVLALSGTGSIASSGKITLSDSATFDISQITPASGISTSVKGFESTSDTTKIVLGAKNLTILGGATTNSLTFAGVISGEGGSLTQSLDYLTLTGVNTYTGETTIGGYFYLKDGGSIEKSSGVTFTSSAGTLDVGTVTTSATIQNLNGAYGTVVISQKTLIVNGTGIFGGMMSGQGRLIKAGSGTLEITNVNNNVSFATVKDTGILKFSGTGLIGTNTNVTLEGYGEFNLASSARAPYVIGILESASANTKVVLGTNTLQTAGNNGETFAGVISGPGGFTRAGGKLTLTGVNTYTGETSVMSGSQLFLDGVGSIAKSSGLTLGNSTFDISGIGADATNINNFNGTGTVTLGAKRLIVNGTGSINAIINGAGGTLTKTGAGKLTLSGTGNYNGGTTVEIGTVSILANGNLGTNDKPTENFLKNATLELTSAGPFTRGWTLTDANTITTSVANTTQSGILRGAGSLTKDGFGILTLTAVNEYSGSTTVSGTGNTLALSGPGSIAASSGLILKDTAIFDVSAITMDSTTVIKGLSGATGTRITLGSRTALEVTGGGLYEGSIVSQSTPTKFIKSGTGKLTLTNASLLSNAVEVTSGELSVNGTYSGALPALAVTVNGTGKLSGTGTINGTVLVSAGGTLSPGDTVGTLRLQDAVYNGDGTILSPFATLLINGTGAETGEYGNIAQIGTFTFSDNSIVTANLTGDEWPENFILEIVTGKVAGNAEKVTVISPRGWELSLYFGDGNTNAYLGVHYTPVPEPSTYALFGAIGAVAVALLRRRRRK